MDKLTCGMTGCEKPVVARSLCGTHYANERRAGRLPKLPPRVKSVCTVEGCDDPVNGRGLCNKHYKRLLTHGDPEAVKIVHGQDEKRFWQQVDTSGGTNACWPWTGQQTFAGYGRFWTGGKSIGATRWLMGHLREEPLSDSEQVCHHCDNPPCCNPAHLYIGDAFSNMHDKKVRGRANNVLAARMSAKTHCPQGHPYDEANTYIGPNGGRNCRTCHRERNWAYSSGRPHRRR